MENEIELPPAELALKQAFCNAVDALADHSSQEALAWLDHIEIERDERGQVRLVPVWLA